MHKMAFFLTLGEKYIFSRALKKEYQVTKNIIFGKSQRNESAMTQTLSMLVER